MSEVFRLTADHQDLVIPASDLMLGAGRDAMTAFQTEEELAAHHDPKWQTEVLSKYLGAKDMPLMAYYVSQRLDKSLNGALAGQVYKTAEGPIIGLIDILAVTKTRTKIGSRLIQAFEADFKQRVDFFTAGVKPNNTASQSLFIANGYQQDGFHPLNTKALAFYKDC